MVDKLAKEAACVAEGHEFHRLLSTQKKEHRQKMVAEWRQEWQTSKVGKHLKDLDESHPSKRALRLHQDPKLLSHATENWPFLATGQC